MWRSSMSLAAAAMIVSPLGIAQESLCNPCVDPPMPRRQEFVSPTDVGVITIEEMMGRSGARIDALLDQLRKLEREKTQPGKDDDESEDSIEADNAVDDSEVPE